MHPDLKKADIVGINVGFKFGFKFGLLAADVGKPAAVLKAWLCIFFTYKINIPPCI